MSLFIKLFERTQEYNSYIASDDKVLPNVSLCEDAKEVYFNPYVPHDYSQDYFTMVVTASGDIKLSGSTTLSYSKDKGVSWSAVTSADTISVEVGNKVLWKGTPTPQSYKGIGRFSGDTNARYSVEGNVMSLLYGDDFRGQTSLSGKDYAFSNLFYYNKNVTSAENLSLPATTLASNCYRNMFASCTNLTTAPELQATTLATECYNHMFNDCTSLTEAPELPATTLSSGCYQSMFYNCRSLTEAPELPATTLANSCYEYMFFYCESLTTAPELPATTLADSCYSSMFGLTNVLPDCSNIDFTSPTVVASGALKGLFASTKITNAKLDAILKAHGINNYSLPVMTLTDSCYGGMFWKCTSLTTAPQLPATTLASGCYQAMFYNCTSLTTPPSTIGDSSTVMTTSACTNMFWGCTSLTTAPQLPATTLADSCYYAMFDGCTRLTTAPELLATTLANECYGSMFDGCRNLNSITCLATDISATRCTNYWLNGVAASGTFTKAASMNDWTSGVSGIPSGWSVKDATLDYFAFKVTANGNIKWSGSTTDNTLSYSKNNGSTWTTVNSADTISVVVGDTILWKGTATPQPSNFKGIGRFSGDDYVRYSVEGNVMSLLYGDDFKGQTSLEGKNYVLLGLFNGNTNVTSAENMSLPATTLASFCYASMFNDCINLTTAPELLATTLADNCYYQMFQGCTNLTTAPELPATTLASECYSSMFRKCTSLTTAPELPAKTLANWCYSYMFVGCTSLNSIKCLATNISASNCTNYWVESVAASGTFTKAASMNDWTSGVSGIPDGWTVKDAT